ncbi:MAG TPA: protein kinase [Gemmatimonadales bacterium]|nr:protein kinase [Gemmatimonadales bacterium]
MTDLRAQLLEGLSGSYTLERELGRGGMATVFLAQDVKHDRPVALKVLHPELAASLGPDRFLREIKLAARLQHPHILTVLDSGNAGGRLWFTMPFVEGESLRERIRRERQLPVEDALRIAREAAQALQYAHDHGVIHRDIKPENMLLTRDGNTLVADFGIARALGPAGDDKLTETGLVVGTPAYMSPEQAAGDRALDARTDVYSLASVLYEMLAGEPPFTGATTQAMLVRRLTEPAPSVRSTRQNVPEAIDQAIRKSLSPVAADRFGTMAQLGQALQAASTTVTQAAPTLTTASTVASPAPGPTVRAADAPAGRRKMPVAATALVLGVLIGLGVLFAWRHGVGPATPAPGGPARLVVLPFENLGDSADAYFASGVSDAVRGKLTELSQLQVIARGSSVQYTGSTRTPGQIAADLGVQYLLTGTVRWAKAADGTSRVQVSPELVQVGGDGAAASKWQQSFEAPLSDVFKVQADIAGQVAQAMRVALPGAAQERLAEAPTHNSAAYDAYLRGRAVSGSTAPADLRRAIAYYEDAVRLDSTFARAWAELSNSYSGLYANSTPTTETARRARAAAERAIAIDPRLADGHRALSQYFLFIEADPARAAPAIEAALKAAPGDPGSLSLQSAVARSQGRFEEALRYSRQLYDLDPRSGGRAGALALTLQWLRRLKEAKPVAERAIALTPGNPTAVERLIMIELGEGNLAGARQVIARSATDIPAVDLAAFVAVYYDLGWVLEDAAQRQVLTLGPDAFDGDPASVAIVRAQILGWRGDLAASRAWGDSAQRAFAVQLREAPNDPQRHVLRGLALAYAGRRNEAIAEGERGVALLPVEKDAETGPYLLQQLARIYVRTGQPEKAIDQLERILKLPYFLTAAWLRIDPEFAPLRGNPRFERLTATTN